MNKNLLLYLVIFLEGYVVLSLELLAIRLTIPFAWGLPYETRSRLDMNIRPLTRDGGARLSVANRLYPIVQEVDRGDLRADWGHFWR